MTTGRQRAEAGAGGGGGEVHSCTEPSCGCTVSPEGSAPGNPHFSGVKISQDCKTHSRVQSWEGESGQDVEPETALPLEASVPLSPHPEASRKVSPILSQLRSASLGEKEVAQRPEA